VAFAEVGFPQRHRLAQVEDVANGGIGSVDARSRRTRRRIPRQANVTAQLHGAQATGLCRVDLASGDIENPQRRAADDCEPPARP
jgi:hypothetical protein